MELIIDTRIASTSTQINHCVIENMFCLNLFVQPNCYKYWVNKYDYNDDNNNDDDIDDENPKGP